MKPATTLVLAVVLLLLGAFYYIHDVHMAGKKEEKKSQEDRVLPFEAGTATALTIKKGSQSISFEKKDGAWYITSPLKQRASTTMVDSLADMLSTTKQEKVIEENPGDLAPFELKPPAVEITVRARKKEGEEPAEFSLFMGSRTPSGSSYYVQVPGKKEVLLIPSAMSTELDKRAEDFQEKEVLPLEPSTVNRLTVQKGEETMVLEKSHSFWNTLEKEPQWKVIDKTSEPGDKAKISVYLSNIKNIKAAAVFDSSDPKAPVIGKGTPMAKLTVEHSDRGPETLVIMPLKGSELPSVREHSGEKLLIKAEDFPKLFRPSRELLDKRIVSFDPADIESLELKYGAQPMITAVKNDEGWKIKKPGGIKKSIPSLDTLMWKLESAYYSAKADSFPGVTDATLTLKEKGGSAAVTIELAKNPADAKKSYARLKDGGIFVISDELLSLLQNIDEEVRKAQEKPGKSPAPSPAASNSPGAATPDSSASPAAKPVTLPAVSPLPLPSRAPSSPGPAK